MYQSVVVSRLNYSCESWIFILSPKKQKQGAKHRCKRETASRKEHNRGNWAGTETLCVRINNEEQIEQILEKRRIEEAETRRLATDRVTE